MFFLKIFMSQYTNVAKCLVQVSQKTLTMSVGVVTHSITNPMQLGITESYNIVTNVVRIFDYFQIRVGLKISYGLKELKPVKFIINYSNNK